MSAPNASYSITMRLRLDADDPTAVGRATTVIGEHQGVVTAVDFVDSAAGELVVDVTANARDSAHGNAIAAAVEELAGVHVHKTSDRTFLIHLKGKLEIAPTVPLRTRDDLSMAYTPGVARVCLAIAANKEDAWSLTIKGNTVAIVTDGTAVLGLGDIGPEAAMPVMEGKAVLFKQFAGVDAWPVCLDTKDADEIVSIVKALAPGFGGINLEDIAAPKCFEIEERLRRELDIPVFHDDQHGTAIVVLAALINACRLTGKKLADLRVAMSGAGAAGTAIARLLMAEGVTNLIAADRGGIIHSGRDDLDDAKQWYLEHTNKEDRSGDVVDVLDGADVFIGVSGPDLFPASELARMAPDPIVFALANPDPEVDPDAAREFASVIATGRSDYPNQINNVLAFPGIFRGALDARAPEITEAMKVAAAHAIAEVVRDDQLNASYIMPSVFNPDVARDVAEAVRRVAAADADA